MVAILEKWRIISMRLWIDDVRPAPKGYVWCKSVNEAKEIICENEISAVFAKMSGNWDAMVEHWPTLIDIDHDAGDYASDGGDYIKLLDWLEETGRNYPIHIHSMNPVGVANMRRIIERNGWEEAK
jgi:hypothetical protein